MSDELENALTKVIEEATDTDEAAQVGRGILHVQILNGPLSLQLKEAIGAFANVLVKNAYVAGFKAGAQSVKAAKPRKGRGFFGRAN